MTTSNSLISSANARQWFHLALQASREEDPKLMNYVLNIFACLSQSEKDTQPPLCATLPDQKRSQPSTVFSKKAEIDIQMKKILEDIQQVQAYEAEAAQKFDSAQHSSRQENPCLMEHLLPMFLLLDKAKELNIQANKAIEECLSKNESLSSLLQEISDMEDLPTDRKSLWKERIQAIEDLRTGTVRPNPTLLK